MCLVQLYSIEHLTRCFNCIVHIDRVVLHTIACRLSNQTHLHMHCLVFYTMYKFRAFFRKCDITSQTHSLAALKSFAVVQTSYLQYCSVLLQFK